MTLFLCLTFYDATNTSMYMALPQGPFYRALGQRIRDARKAKNLRQAQLATAVGLTRTSITNLETGRQPVAVHTLCKIADALGTTAANLLPTRTTPSDLRGVTAEQIRHLEADKRQWVARVLQTPNQETIDVTQIHTRKEASGRTPKGSPGEEAPGADRKVSRTRASENPV